MSAPCLYRTRNAVRIQCLLGVCPFTRHANAVRCSARVTVVTGAHALQVLCMFGCLADQALRNLLATGVMGTLEITFVMEHTTLFGVYASVRVRLWCNRHRHARLLNSVAAAYDRMEMLRPNQWSGRNLSVSTVGWLCAHFGITAAAGMRLFSRDTSAQVYFLIFQVAMSTVFAVGLHVRVLLLLLTDVHRVCAMTLSNAAERRPDGRRARALDVLVVVHQCRKVFWHAAVDVPDKGFDICDDNRVFYGHRDDVSWRRTELGVVLFSSNVCGAGAGEQCAGGVGV